MSTIDNKQKLEKKIGESVGLEMAAQKAVEERGSRGLLDIGEMKSKLERMRKEASNRQMELEQLVQKLSESEGMNASNIQDTAKETEQRLLKMMKTYLGENRDSAEAIVLMIYFQSNTPLKVYPLY